MKLAEIVLCVTTILLVTFTTGNGAPQWRPQGRFGKRLDPPLPLLQEHSAESAPFPGAYEIPIEKFHDNGKVNALRIFGRLCTLSDIPGFPKCLWSHGSSAVADGIDIVDVKK